MFKKLWYNLNYRYCMSNRYLASQRLDTMAAVKWERDAYDWQLKWRFL